MDSKAVIVTGGSGFLGTLICQRLAEQGHSVVNIDEHKHEIPGVAQYPFKIDSIQTEGIVALTKPDTIIHLSNHSEHTNSITDAAKDLSDVIYLLIAAENHDVQNFIFLSDTQPDSAPVFVEFKKLAEAIINSFTVRRKINSAIIRNAILSGACVYQKHGRDITPHHNDCVTRLTRNVVQGLCITPPFFGGGNDYDIVHVADAANDFIQAHNYLCDNDHSFVMDMTANECHSDADICQELSRLSGEEITIDWDDETPVDAKQYLWPPFETDHQYTFKDIVRHTYEWETKNRKKHAPK
jgi:nucleoside-diphosphate-sugar epimerase